MGEAYEGRTMPDAGPERNGMTTQEKLDLIAQIEESMVPGAPDNEEKMERVADLWDGIDPKELTIPDDVYEELARRDAYDRQHPDDTYTWEQVKEWVLNRGARTR